MSIPDNYQSIDSPSKGEFRDKGSKFIGYAYPIGSIDEVQIEISELRRIHPKARHFCYAYRLGVRGELFRINDDGEPSGSAGLPIYHEILRHGFSGVLVVVVRYFGGTKLGIPGLIQAYRAAAHEALSTAEPSDVILYRYANVKCPIGDMGSFYQSSKLADLEIIGTEYDSTEVTIHIRQRISTFDASIIKLVAHFEQIDESTVLQNFKNSRLQISIIAT